MDDPPKATQYERHLERRATIISIKSAQCSFSYVVKLSWTCYIFQKIDSFNGNWQTVLFFLENAKDEI
jgi:hypothetical protein